MAKKMNKRNKGNECVYYASLKVIDTREDMITNETFLEQIRVNLDYDLYNSFKKQVDGSYFLNEKNEKLIKKTLARFAQKALDTDNLDIKFDTVNMQIALYKCEGCSCRHVMLPSIICLGESFPQGQCLVVALDFMDREFC